LVIFVAFVPQPSARLGHRSEHYSTLPLPSTIVT